MTEHRQSRFHPDSKARNRVLGHGSSTLLLALVVLGLWNPARALAQPDDPDAVGILWVGTSSDLFKVETQTGEILLQAPGPVSPTEMAVDRRAEILWAHTDSTLHAIDFQGQPLFTVPLSAAGSATDLKANAIDGEITVVIGDTSYTFDTAGQPLGSFTAPEPILAIGMDRWGRRWFAHSQSIVVYDQASGAVVKELDLGSGKTNVLDMDLRRKQDYPTPFDSDPLYVLSSNKGLEDFHIFFDYEVGGDNWTSLPRDVHSLSFTYSTNGVAVYRSDGTSVASPLQSPITHIATEDQGLQLLDVWIGGGSQIARVDFGGVDHLIRDLGPGVEITAMAVNEREQTAPRLTVMSEQNGAWVAENPPQFEFSYRDLSSPYDFRMSGVDPSSLVIDWIHSDEGWPTGILDLTCTQVAGDLQCTPNQSIEEGLNRFEASIADYAENRDYESTYPYEYVQWEITIDSVPPTVEITQPLEGAELIDRSPPVEMTYSDTGTTPSEIASGSVAVFANDVSIQVSCSGTGSPTVCDLLEPLPIGPVTLRAEVNDVAGGTGVDQINVTVSGDDTFPPDLTILSPDEGAQRTPARVRIDLAYTDIGQGIDTSSLSVLANGASLAVTCSMAGSEVEGELHCVPDAPMPLGPWTLDVTITDLAGNASTPVQRTFTVVEPFTEVTGTVAWPDGQPAVGAEVSVRGKIGAQAISDGSGAFTIPDVPVESGEKLTVTAVLEATGTTSAAAKIGIVPVYGGTVSVGDLELQPLCAYHFSERFGAPGNRLPDLPYWSHVAALAVFDDGSGSSLYAAGAAGNMPGFVAKWTGAGWDIFAQADGAVRALAVFDDGTGPALYAAGSFTSIDGTSLSRTARWDGASWSSVGGGVSGTVAALEVLDDGTGQALYAGGSFTSAGGAEASRVARWDGSNWAGIGNGLDSSVLAIEVFDHGTGPALYVGGTFDFDASGSVQLDHLARLAESSWTSVGAGTSGWVYSLEAFEFDSAPALFVSGTFSQAGGVAVRQVARWDGSSWADAGTPSLSGFDYFEDLEVLDDGVQATLFGAGDFGNGNVLQWNGTGWNSIDGNFGGVGPVLDLLATHPAPITGRPALYVGGDFDTASGLPSHLVAEWVPECDVTPPDIDILSHPNPAATNQTTISLTGRVNAGRWLWLDDQPVPLQPDGSFGVGPLTLSEGLQRFDLTAFDDSGNAARVPFQVLRDVVAPSVEIVAPPDGATVVSSRPIIELEYADDHAIDPESLSIEVGGTPIEVGCVRGETEASCQPLEPLPSGPVTVVGRIADLSTNVATSSNLTLTISPEETIVTGTVRLPGGSAVTGAEVTVLGQPGTAAMTAGDGSFTVTGVLIEEALSVVARYGDASGALSGIVRDVIGVPGGVTDVGVIQLTPLCDLELEADFAVGIGVDGAVYSDEPRVTALAVFDDGQGDGPVLYVGGEFTNAGGVKAHGIARWDGTRWNEVGGGLYNGGNVRPGIVRALKVFDDGSGPALFVGGQFTSAGGTAAGYLVRWDGSQWSSVGGNFSSTVFALEVADLGQGPVLVAGGGFSSAPGGVSASRVAYWDGQTWSPMGEGIGGTVYTLAVYNALKGKGQTIYAGGSFDQTGDGTTARYLVGWDGSGWKTIGGGLAGRPEQGTSDHLGVYSSTVFDGQLIIGGAFDTAGGVEGFKGIAAWDGRTWSKLGSNFSGGEALDIASNGVQALAVFDDGAGPALYAIGQVRVDGEDQILARWDGVTWTVGARFYDSPQPGVEKDWNGMALHAFDDDPADGMPARLIVGTTRTQATQPDGSVLFINQIAAWDGVEWQALGEGPPGTIWGIATAPVSATSAFFVSGTAGDFGESFLLQWNGRTWAELPGFWYRRDRAGVEISFPSHANLLSFLDLGEGPALYAAGEFEGAGPWEASGLVRWDGRTWVPIPTDSLRGGPLGASSSNYISVLGVFDAGAGPALLAAGRYSIAILSGSSWHELGAFDRIGISCIQDGIGNIAVFDDGSGSGPALFAAGCFNVIDGVPVQYLARWDGSSWSAAGDFDDVVEDIAVFDDGTGPALYAAGEFTTVDGTTVNHVARWDGTAWRPVGSGFSRTGSRNRLAVVDTGQGPELWFSGSIRQISSLPVQYGRGLARWDGTQWSTSDTGEFLPGVPVATFDDGTGPALWTVQNQIFDSSGTRTPIVLAKLQRTFECAPESDTTPPEMSFQRPTEGESLLTLRPELALAYSDSGSGVDTSTLAVEANGAPLPVTCSFLVAEASCTPEANLPGGGVTLTATISDAAGNQSAPAQVNVTVVAGTPTISFIGPTEGEIVLTDQPEVRLSYTENADPSTLDLQSSPVAVSFSCTTTATEATCSPLSSLPEGSNTLTATVSGFDGSSATPAQVTFTVDTSQPALAFTAPEEGNTTNEQQPELRLSYDDSGSGVDTSTLRIQEDGLDLPATCTFGATEAVCTPTDPLAEGAHTLTATVADFAGWTSASAQVAFEIVLDFTAPVIALTAPERDGSTTAVETRFVGSLDEAGSLTLDGNPVPLDGANAFDHGPVPLEEGWNRFELVATDIVGNVTQETVRVLRDTEAPRLSFLAPTEGTYFDPSATPFELRWGDSGAGIDPATLQITANDAPLDVTCEACGTGVACTPVTPPADTVVTLEATVADGVGLTALARVRFTTDPDADIVAPEIYLTAPISGSVTNQPEERFIGDLSEPATLAVGGEPATVDSNQHFDHSPVVLVEGANTVELRATDHSGNVGTLNVTITLDSTPPAPIDASLVTVSEPSGGMVTVTGAAGSVDPVEPDERVRVENTFAAGYAEVAPAADGSFSAVLAAVSEDELAVATRDAIGNRSPPRLLVVPGTPTLPPDPAAVAPLLDPTAATGPCDLFAFLYTGADPIQTGVASGAIECQGASLLRGRVLDRTGQPISGVRVSGLRGPDLGSTLTRTDGAFDLVVPGGSEAILQFHEAGHLPVHRRVSAPRGASATVPDVVLTALDAAVTPIDASGASAAMQVARGGAVTDADGTRRATLLFPAGTTATLRYPGGATEAVTTLGIRATEYTVGPSGPTAMPAALPPTSAYTYAVEFSADEALAAGAAGVGLDRPVLSYTENFLGFPTGLVIPVGSYDRELGRWVPEENGRVIEILGVTGGLADLDVDGAGTPADAARLAELGITDAERAELATLYAIGESLWRVRITHFTPYDCNLPVFPPPGATVPDRPEPKGGDRDKKDIDCLQGGSVIECTNQVLGEDVGVTGTPYALHYRSDRVPGRKAARTLEISLSGASPPASLERIDLTLDVAGQRLSQSFLPAADLSHTFTWDGQDGFGRTIQGATEATVSIGYVYDTTYARPPDDEIEAFARPGTAELTGNPGREQIVAWQRHRAQLTRLDVSELVGLGGWTLSPHHAYDPHSRTLYYGDGGRRTVHDVTVIKSAAGTGEAGFGGDGGSAEEALLDSPNALLVSRDASGTPDGSYFVADTDNCRVRHVDAAGTIRTVAGAGCRFAEDGVTPAPASGDGGPATAATLHRDLGQLAQGPDGSLYLADAGHFSIRKVAPDGTISTVAGYDWFHGAEPGPTPATQVQFANQPWAMTVNAAGDLYVGFMDAGGLGVVYRFASPLVEPEVILQGEVGNGLYHYLREPQSFRLDPNGNLLIADGFSNSIFRYGWDASFTEVAGGCQTLPDGQFTCTGDAGDGGPATEALLNDPIEMGVGPDGSVLFTDRGNHKVRRIDPAGRISTVAGTGAPGFNGDGRPARQSELDSPVGLEILPDRSVLVADAANHRVRRIEDVLPPVPQTGLILVPEEDGRTRYVFDLTGRHLRTEDARTGEVLLTFAYTPEGLLSGVTDAFGNATAVERDAAGAPQALVAPFGQRTALTIHPSGYLATIANPAGESLGLGYSSDGLLTGLTDPRSNPYTFDYDPLGRLRLDSDPASGSTGLARTELPPAEDLAGGFEVTKTSALGRTTTYRTEELTTGDTRLTVTDPAGLATVSLRGRDGSRTTTTPDGTVATATEGPDPRFGMQAPRLQGLTVTTPGGLSSSTIATRAVTLVNPSGDPKEPANVASVTNTVTVNGKTATSVQDLVARRTTTTSPEDRQGDTTFDVFGRPTELRPPGVAPVQYGYDARGRLQTVTQGTRTTTYTFDAGTGFLSAVTDPAAREVSFTHDAAGRVLTQTLPDLRVVTFGYDASGNLTSVTPPGRPAHAFSHTPVDLPETYTPPDVGLAEHATTLSYNADRQVELVTRPDGQTIDPVYDTTSGRLTSLVSPRGTYGYSYDPATGNLATVTDTDAGSLAFGYDGSLPTSVTWTGEVAGSVGFTYDDDFELVSRTVNGADPVAFSYDQDGLLTGAGLLSLSRDATSGFLSGTTLGSLSDSYGYDPTFGELASYTAADGGTDLYAATYARDGLGRIEQKVETIEGVTTTYDYRYDPAGRLTDVDQDEVNVAHYDYDANSNRTAWTDPWGSGTATYDDQDRLTSYAGTTYTYTANGELASKTAGTQTVTFDYDVTGALLGATLADGLRIDYVHDAAHRPVGKKVGGTLVQGFLYQDALNPVAELDGTGTVVSTFVYASKANVPDYLVKAGTTYRIVSDHLGSVRLVVNTTDGTIAQRLDYDAFGRITLDTNPGFQPFGFAGGLYDRHTGLVRFGARDYDPETGRWTAKDPILFSGGDTNLYGYVLNDPVNLNDPNGQIVPLLLAAWGAVEIGLTIWDLIDAGATLLDPCASGLDKGLSAGGLVAGAILPGGGYGTLGKRGAKGVRRGGAGAAKAFHHTTDQAVSSIMRTGLRPGSYATPTGGLGPLQAHIELALDPAGGARNAVLQIDVAALRAVGYEIPPVTRVPSAYGMPGGGFEMRFPYKIRPEFLKVVQP